MVHQCESLSEALPPRALILALAALLGLASLTSAKDAPPKPPSNDDCLTCHDDASATRSDGRPLPPVKDKLASSLHGALGIACVDCHVDLAKATDFPHEEKLQRASCAACHDDAVAAYTKSIHASARREAADSPAASCADCHGSHDIKPSSDPASLTNHFNVPDTCAKCHGNPDTIEKGKIAAGNVPLRYDDSIHGKALHKSGLKVAPNCYTCHGNHEIRQAKDQASKVSHGNIPGTCGTCHEGIKTVYDASVHGQALEQGNPRAAVCADCHTAHGIKTVGPSWHLEVARECGTCHQESIRTFRDTFHGKVTALGFVRAASCSDCHGSHDILPKRDPRSKVAAGGRLATCRKCHTGVPAKFARYDPHADPENRDRNPGLYYTTQFMRLLLGTVFAFFGIHTALWLPRSWKARRDNQNNGKES